MVPFDDLLISQLKNLPTLIVDAVFCVNTSQYVLYIFKCFLFFLCACVESRLILSCCVLTHLNSPSLNEKVFSPTNLTISNIGVHLTSQAFSVSIYVQFSVRVKMYHSCYKFWAWKQEVRLTQIFCLWKVTLCVPHVCLYRDFK